MIDRIVSFEEHDQEGQISSQSNDLVHRCM